MTVSDYLYRFGQINSEMETIKERLYDCYRRLDSKQNELEALIEKFKNEPEEG